MSTTNNEEKCIGTTEAAEFLGCLLYTSLRDTKEIHIRFADGTTKQASVKKKDESLGFAIYAVAKSSIAQSTWQQISICLLYTSIQAGARTGYHHHRLLTVNDRKCRKEFRIQTAGSLRHFPSVKGTCQRAECAGCSAVTVKPCGRKPAGQAADACLLYTSRCV